MNTLNLNDILTELESKLSDPEWLSNTCIRLAALLIDHNHEMARAHRLEAEAAYRALAEAKRRGEKMANAEADRLALIETEDAYTDYKLANEAIVELINSIKIRLKVLEWEHAN